MEEAAAATKAHGPRRGLGLVWRRFIAEPPPLGRHGDDHGVGLAGADVPVFCGLSGFAIGRIMEIAMADATYPRRK